MRSRFVLGMVMNAIAGLAVLVSGPWLYMPVAIFLFGGFLASSLLFLAMLVMLPLIILGPVVGMITAARDGSRRLSVGTALTSMGLLATLIAVATSADLVDLERPGEIPVACVRKVNDASAIGRTCDHDCPQGYVCEAASTARAGCQIPCTETCDCPQGSKCVNWKCGP